MTGRKMKMPLDFLALHPPQRKVHFDNVQERVWSQQKKYKNYADDRRSARQSNIHVGDRVRFRIPVRHNKLDPIWSSRHLVMQKPAEHTVELDNGSRWNAEKLMVDNHENDEMPPLEDIPANEMGNNYEDSQEPVDSQEDREISQEQSTDIRANVEVAWPGEPEHQRAWEPENIQQEPGIELRRSQRVRHAPKKFEDYDLNPDDSY